MPILTVREREHMRGRSERDLSPLFESLLAALMNHPPTIAERLCHGLMWSICRADDLEVVSNGGDVSIIGSSPQKVPSSLDICSALELDIAFAVKLGLFLTKGHLSQFGRLLTYGEGRLTERKVTAEVYNEVFGRDCPHIGRVLVFTAAELYHIVVMTAREAEKRSLERQLGLAIESFKDLPSRVFKYDV